MGFFDKIFKKQEVKKENTESIIENNEERIFDLINKADSFQDLFTYLDRIEGLQGSQRFFQRDELIAVAKKVRSGEFSLNAATRTGGFRNKLEELIKKERDLYNI